MKEGEEIVQIVISKLDLFVIARVKQLRESKGISQDNLSVKMGFSEKFVGSIENPRLKSHYNIRHLNLIAKALNCRIQDFFPSQPLDEDLVTMKINRTNTTNKDGSKSKRKKSTVVGIKHLSK